ncbi:thioredoxin-like protein [Massarina eburnea CBS 473.64]|uniref:Thioredoxin-like protein n=1 Tax=Massarina eburnea CBS 473.64 TaxID=1395130 RepID=A0A6A6S5D3_9PLEO|nr:thioredoxin-like protein [Massarina eburnea CBS 473.64]
MPPITLHFLQASRSIRIAWLLELLNQPYTVKFADRLATMKAPDDFKAGTGNPLGKAPSLQDGELTVYESGAITEYLCDTYDESHNLLPSKGEGRVKVLQWIHAAEATFMLHALAITYVRWNMPKSGNPTILSETESGLSINVQKDLEWLETELVQSSGGFLCGKDVTAADTMMQFSLEFIFKTELGTQGKGVDAWPNIRAWLGKCEGLDSYRKAVEKTGYKLGNKMPEGR